MLGRDSPGDDDLVLGMLRAGMGAEALRSPGLTLEGVRAGEMLSDALASVEISLEEVRRGSGGRLRHEPPSRA